MDKKDVKINKDVREYEPKLVSHFTLRQTVCIIVITVIFFAWKTFLTEILGFTTISYLPACIPASIPLAFGWGHIVLGMPVETYMKYVFFNNLLAKRHRVFRTHNYITIEYEKTLKEMKKNDTDNKDKPSRNIKITDPECRAFD